MNEINQNNPYRTPEADLSGGVDNDLSEVRYAGFWIRTLAAVIDTIIIVTITFPLLYLIYGQAVLTSDNFIEGIWDVIISYVFPFAFTVGLWMKFGGTPGKRMLGLKVLDENTQQHVNVGSSLIRYIGYFPAMMVLFIGIFWIAFDKKKKGWHDHMAGTIVVKD